LQVDGTDLPGIEVIADDFTENVLLGCNALNCLILLLASCILARQGV